MSNATSKWPSRVASVTGLALFLSANGSFAQNLAATLGKVEYRTNCMVCHGEEGQGDGPMADQLAMKPANLQMIGKNNNGIFPFDKVYDTIDGRDTIRAHGTSDMPVWGDAYVASVSGSMSKETDPQTSSVEAAITGRILSLVYYLQSIQAE